MDCQRQTQTRTQYQQLDKAEGGLNGLTREQFLKKYYDPNATKYITKGKRKYLFPFDKEMKRKVEPLRKPYPKENGWVKKDKNVYKTEMLKDYGNEKNTDIQAR